MKSYEEGKQAYWSIKEGKRKQYARPVPRNTIDVYLQGFKDGFERGKKLRTNA